MDRRVQVSEIELAAPRASERPRSDRPSRSAASGTIEQLQRTAGNRRTAQLLSARAQSRLLQRQLQIGDDEPLTRFSRHHVRRPLMNQIDGAIKRRGFATTVGAYSFVQERIDDGELHRFAAVTDLVDALFRAEVLYKPARGGSLGPRKLGDRPDFSAAARNLPAGLGQARRHVISSSALGRAVELAVDSAFTANRDRPTAEQTAYQAVYGFLARHIAGLPALPFSPTNLHAAARTAWELVHNHVGNLWLGPTVPNSVRGFIRGTFRAERAELEKLPAQQPVSVIEILDRVDDPRGPGMQRQDAATLWSVLASEFRRVLLASATPEGHVGAGLAANVVREFELNADLDLPQTANGELAVHENYLTDAIGVYLELMHEPTLAIFAPGGALDRFMGLQVGSHVQGGPRS